MKLLAQARPLWGLALNRAASRTRSGPTEVGKSLGSFTVARMSYRQIIAQKRLFHRFTLPRVCRDITHRTSRGVALIEAALAIPVILLFIGGAIDLGSLLVRYVSASKLSYEGARYAAQLQDLELNDTPPSEEGDGGVASVSPNCTEAMAGADPLSQVCRRIIHLMPDETFLRTANGAVVYTASRPAPCTTNNEFTNPDVIPPISKVEVSVSLEWHPLLLTFLDIDQVTASTTAPYLGNKGADVTSCDRDM